MVAEPKKNEPPSNDSHQINKKKTWMSALINPTTKTLLINHLLPIVFFLFLSIFIFRNIIGADGVIIHKDLIYSPDLGKFAHYFYPMWDDNIGLSALQRLPRLLLYLPFMEIGFLFDLVTTNIFVLTFIFCEFFAGISMYYISRYFLMRTYLKKYKTILRIRLLRCPQCDKKITIAGAPGNHIEYSCPRCGKNDTQTIQEEKQTDPAKPQDETRIQNWINGAAIIAGLVFMWSLNLLNNFTYPHQCFAYALSPLILFLVILGFEKKKALYFILAGFLWSTACADLHYAILGAILFMSYIAYNFIVELIRLLPKGKWHAFKAAFLTHVKYTFIFVGSVLAFSAYWLIPGYFMGGTTRYKATIFAEMNRHLYSQTPMINLMGKQVAVFYFPEVYNDPTEILTSAGVQNLFFLMSLVVFIFALVAFFLKPKNKYVLYFSILTLVTLFAASLPMFSQNLYYWFVNKAPLSNLYGWVFKRPQIEEFLSLTVAFLIGFSIIEILLRIQKSKLKNMRTKKWIPIVLLCFLIFSILLPTWPLATGDNGGVLKPGKIPSDFDKVNAWLENEQGDFKVLWLPDYWGTNITWYLGNQIDKDIAGLTSSKPTYMLWGPNEQPNVYGIRFFGSCIMTLDDNHALLLKNTTRDIGKFLAPLGIKYIIFHDDNATSWDDVTYKNAKTLYTVLQHQNDLQLIQQFGIISVFKNTYFNQTNNTMFYTNSDTSLIFGGLGTLPTLSSIPTFQSRNNAVIFANQIRYQPQDLKKMINTLVFTQTVDPEEIAFTFIDDKYLVTPSNFPTSLNAKNTWSETKFTFWTDYMYGSLGEFGRWEMFYDDGVAFTICPGIIRPGHSITTNDLIARHNFENDSELKAFRDNATSNLNISLSNYSVSGNTSMMGTIAEGPQNTVQHAQSDLIPLPMNSYNYRVNVSLAAKNVTYVQIKLNYFDEQLASAGWQFLITRSGTFNYTTLEKDFNAPPQARFVALQIFADQNPISNSSWWVDDFRLYDLFNITTFPRLNMSFSVDNPDTYEIFIRDLKCSRGGKMNVILDGNQVTSLSTYSTFNKFQWEKICSSNLSKGSHVISVDNIGGFNALNLIAVVPKRQMENYYSLANDYINQNSLMYTLEAETDFYSDNAKISDSYGNFASGGKVLSLQDNGSVWLPVHVLRSGNYSISIKHAGGSPNNQLLTSWGNESHDVGYANDSTFAWSNITNLSLTEGVHNLSFWVAPPVPLVMDSFEASVNSTSNIPENWSSGSSLYSMALDATNRTNGTYSLKITTNSTVPYMYSRISGQELFLNISNNYTAKIDMKTENMNGSRVMVLGYNESTALWDNLAMVFQTQPGDVDWKQYAVSFYVSQNISEIKFLLDAGWVLNASNGNATVWFDNLRIFNTTGVTTNNIDLVVLYSGEQNQTPETFFNTTSKATILSYTKIDNVTYQVNVNATQPFTLGFEQVYDEYWVAYVDGKEISSVPIYSMLNGFFINKTGNFTITLKYIPQRWFDIGAGITVLTGLGSIGYGVWSWRWGGRKKRKAT